jgi:hypothetical protein
MKSRIVAASIAGALTLSASAAFAAPIISDTAVNAGAGTAYAKRYIALEVYNNGVGINADTVPFFVRTGASLITGAAVNIQVNNGKVNEGAGQLFLTAPGAAITLSTVCTGGALVAGTNYLVGESAAQGVVTPVTTTIYDNNTFCVRNALGTSAGASVTIAAGSVVSTAHGTVASTAPQIATTTTNQAINLSVNSGLNPDCVTKPTVSLAYVTNQETAGPTDVLQIIPQITGTVGASAFTASLDSDNSFQSFLTATNVLSGAPKNVITTSLGSGATATLIPFVNLVDQQVEGINGVLATASQFKAFVATSATTALTFGITSAAAEPGVSMIYRVGATPVTLTNVGNVWTLPTNADTLANLTATAFRSFTITNDVTKPMNPTQWTLSAFSLSVNGFPTCVVFNPAPTIGNWTGGLEAYIPFVKDGGGYSTIIKLNNRYTKDAVLFVAALSGANANTANVVTSTKQLTLPGQFTADQTKIPANGGQVAISGFDLVNNSVITAADALTGAAVKILLRVPTQQDFTVASSGTLVAGTYTQNGPVAANSIADPYITGVVVQTVPGGSQRAINLNFKLSRNGALVAN